MKKIKIGDRIKYYSMRTKRNRTNEVVRIIDSKRVEMANGEIVYLAEIDEIAEGRSSILPLLKDDIVM